MLCNRGASETKKNADKIEPSENNPRKKKKRILPSIPIETSIENRHSTNIPLKGKLKGCFSC